MPTLKPEPIVNNIKLWLHKSQLRQNQLKEWLQTAPQLFISDLLRDQKFELQQDLAHCFSNGSETPAHKSAAAKKDPTNP